MILRFNFRRFIGSREFVCECACMRVKYFYVTTNDATSICTPIHFAFLFVVVLFSYEKRVAPVGIHVFLYVHEYVQK